MTDAPMTHADRSTDSANLVGDSAYAALTAPARNPARWMMFARTLCANLKQRVGIALTRRARGCRMTIGMPDAQINIVADHSAPGPASITTVVSGRAISRRSSHGSQQTCARATPPPRRTARKPLGARTATTSRSGDPCLVEVEHFESASLAAALTAAFNDNRASDVELDQYYTRQDVAAHFYGIFTQHFDPAHYRMVEPSAGTGSFFKLLPPGSLGYDIEPKYFGIRTADFLTVEIESDRRIAIIGNPPYGKNSSTAVRFFNHAARQSSVIAFILPKTFRKAFIENRLDPAFHLMREEAVPANAFLFRSKPYNVPAVFQIWKRGPELRRRRHVETEHPDFVFTKPDKADFAIQRVGARAGRVHHDFSASPSSHYFIRGDVEHIMVQLDFTGAVGNVAGNPSLAKSEIVSLYREWTNQQGDG